MAYIGVSPGNGVRKKHTYTADASQTSFTGAGAEGVTLSYKDSNFVDVYQNGVKLAEADYTSTSGTTVVLAQAAAADDIVEIIVYDVFSVADTVSKADGGTFDGNVAFAGNLSIGSTAITSTAAELNILDGVTSTAAELNILDGVTSTATELNLLDGVTATTAELNILDGVTSTAAELNALDGITAVVGELNALDIGSTAVGTAVASKAVILDSSKDYTGIRNLTISGELDAATLDISGDADIDGTLEADAMTLNGTAITTVATLSTGISNGNLPVFTSGVADDDFLRVNGTSIEGRSASEVLSDIGASAVAGSSSIVTSGALNAGSITSGFGAINNGASAITTTGVGSFGSLDISGDIDVDGTTNLDVVDIDGAVDMATTALVTGVLTANGGAVFNEGGADVDFRVESDTVTHALFVDGANGNVGIGTSSPNAKLDVNGGVVISPNTDGKDTFDFGTQAANDGRLRIRSAVDAVGVEIQANGNSYFTGGNLFVGKTSASDAVVGTELRANGQLFATAESNYAGHFRRNGSDGAVVYFLNDSAIAGYVNINGATSVQYITSSDYRLKENVVTDWDATTRLKQLKPSRFNFIAEADRTVDGFLAHEVQAVVPEAISGTKDAMTAEVLYVEGDELPDGKVVGDVKTASEPDYQGIDQSKLVPLLVKALQEQQATIEALTARIVTLENA